MKKIAFIVLVICLLACHRQPEETTADEKEKKNGNSPLVQIGQVERGRIRHVTTVTATLEAEREVNIVSETMGIVEQIMIEEGDLVKKGEVVATLKHRDEEIALKKAEVEYKHQQSEMQRNSTLYDQGLLSPEAHAQTEYLFDQARVVLEDARMRLEKTSILAPFSGVVAKRHIYVGQHVQALMPLFTISDVNPLLARIYLPEETACHVHPGDSVDGFARENSSKFVSRVLRVSPVVDAQTGTVEIVLSVSNPAEGMKPGSFVTFDVVDMVKNDAVLIPIRALVSELDQNWVYTVNDRTAHRKDVDIGWRNGTIVEILEGVEPGETVVTVGKEGLKEGLKVKIESDLEAGEASNEKLEKSEQPDRKPEDTSAENE